MSCDQSPTMLLKTALLLLVAGGFQIEAQLDGSVPIPASEYYKVAKQGFSTNWFKTADPLAKYSKQNIIDVKARGFTNLRIRCNAELAHYNYTNEYFNTFLRNLKTVVKDCLEVGVAPIISWIHHIDEGDATEYARQKYVEWWGKVAYKLRTQNYRLSFNLFTELGIDYCQSELPNCDNSLRRNKTAYAVWTRDVINAIRNSGGKNKRRILILASPDKKSKGLKNIPVDLYENKPYVMAEYHTYASGAVDDPTTPKSWHGNGSESDRQNLLDEIALAEETNIPTYWGAWMPQDNSRGTMDQYECEEFSKFFVETLKDHNIPWSLNVLDRYYDTVETRWITELQEIGKVKETQIMLNMSQILDVMIENM